MPIFSTHMGNPAEETEAGRPRPEVSTESRFDRFSALVALTLFGLTWPVLDLLGRNAEFFLARRSAKTEVVIMALTAVVVVPIVVGLLGSLPGRAGRALGLALIAFTTTSLALLYLARTGLPWWMSSLIAVGVGVGSTWAFVRLRPVRQAARYLVVAPVVMLGVFFFSMPVGDVLWEPDIALGNPVAIEDPAPIVMLVFDEFPVASLIEPDGDLQVDRFPNFARLAADGVWFRNAVTVEQQTEQSVPAMLTGRVPEDSLVPVAGQYPFNLFTALRSVYDLYVHESITQLCPRELCQGVPATASSLVGDVSVVAGHVLLPEPLTEDLPPIDRGWGDFATAAGAFNAREEFREVLSKGPRAAIDATLEDIESAEVSRPALFYMHAIVPHHPWQFLPDGRNYPYIAATNPASVGGGWNDDEFLVAQSMQRHLLQVGYADYVLGEVIDSLEKRGIYDDAMVVVVADHGITIRPGVEHQRAITETTVGSIAAVPLFVKTPHGDGGTIDDRRALTIDILPTIADVIGASLPTDVEGVSLLGPAPDRTVTTTFGPRGNVTYGVSGDEKLEVARSIFERFPDGDPWALRPLGTPDLAALKVDVEGLASSRLRSVIRESSLYRNVDTEAETIPARIGGTILGGAGNDTVLAVAVNGVVGAVTRTYEVDGSVSFLAMVSPDLLQDGENVIEVLEVTDGGDLLRLDA